MDETDTPTQKSTLFKILGLLCVTAVLIVTIVMALNKDDVEQYYNVSATGKIMATPDIAMLTIGVYTEAKPTAAQSVKDNTDKMNEIITALKGIDIERKDIETSNYSLNPVYDWTDKSGRNLRGYEVRQDVTIKIRNLDNIGKAIQVTTEKGANQIGGISFTIDDPESLKAEARVIAIAKAKDKAKTIASESGLKIKRLVNVYESNSYYPVARANKSYALDSSMGMGGESLPEPTIETGQQEVTVEMTLVYEVK